MGRRDKIQDEDIQALVDGELSFEEERAVQHAMAHDPFLQERYNALIHQKNLIKAWWKDH